MKPNRIPKVALLALALPALGLATQDGGPEIIPIDEDDPIELNPFREQAQASPQQRMIELFHEVEGKLNGATDLLFDAAQGDLSALDEVANSGIDEIDPPDDPGARSRGSLASLLGASSAEGQAVLSGIDEIIQLANEQGGGS